MAYLNTKENEKRYQAIKAEYQAQASKRDVMRQVKRASLEVAKSMLQDIDNEISEWREQHWWGMWTHEKQRAWNELLNARRNAKELIERKKQELAEVEGVTDAKADEAVKMMLHQPN